MSFNPSTESLDCVSEVLPEKLSAIDALSLDSSISFLNRDIWLFNDSIPNGLDFRDPLAEDVVSTICTVPALQYNTITPLPDFEANIEYQDKVVAYLASSAHTYLEGSTVIPASEQIDVEDPLLAEVWSLAGTHIAGDQQKSSYISSSELEVAPCHKEVNQPVKKKKGRPRKGGKVSEPSHISYSEGYEALEAERAKRAAHSTVEKRYRINLSQKLDELKDQLASISESEGTDLTVQLKKKHPYQESSKIRKSDILSEAASFIAQSQKEKVLLRKEIEFLRARAMNLEKFTKCQDCVLLKQVSAMALAKNECR